MTSFIKKSKFVKTHSMNFTILFSFIIFLFVSVKFKAQVSNEGQPKSWELQNTQPISPIILPSFNERAIQIEDEINDKNLSITYRFGYKFEVDYNLQNSGTWETLPNGDRIWRIRFFSNGAKSLNFILEDFFIPFGANLFLYNNDKSDLLGAYNSIQNNKNKTLGTWLVKGEDITLEYFEPASQFGKGSFTVRNITHGYRSGNLNASDDCNFDVNCSIGSDADPLKDIAKKSVALILVNGASMCSGALINNTANDKKPYFLTADHCYSDPATWAFKFNWISTNTVCGTAEDSVSNTDHHTISGATLKARREATDFCLVEINSAIPEEWETVWSGWDRSDVPAPWVFGIHHPAGDIMKVLRDSNPSPTGFMWTIENLEKGHAQNGSSGSPLFNNDGKIVGQLCCGYHLCQGTESGYGVYRYGRFDYSWNGGGTATTQLKDWLDPINSGVTVLDHFPITNMNTSDNSLSQINVYPNPSKDIFTIDLQNSNTETDYELISVNGSLIMKGKFKTKINRIDLSSKPNGIYILKLMNDKATIKTIKLSKQ